LRRPLRVSIPSLKQGQNQLDFLLEPKELEFRPREVAENPSFELLVGPVQVSVTIVRAGRRLLVTGTVRFRARLECALCGVEFESDFEEPLSAEFSGGGLGAEPDPAEDEGETLPVRGDFIDLRPLVHDAIHLAVPIAPACRPNCRGLCPECGADLNRGSCDCGAKTRSRGTRLTRGRP
jgi:uncharacterized protein